MTFHEGTHLRDLLLVFDVRLPVTIERFLLQHCLLVEQSLGERMIFTLNTFSFTFSHAHVKTHRTARARRLDHILAHRSISILADGRCHRAPLARAYLDQLVEQDLVILVDCQVAFILQEILRFLSLFPALLKHLAYIASRLNLLGLARVNPLDLLLMVHELSVG